eukprot:Hpha_TRINITY_DN5709_c0_g1::TRINITY_DN5709_c0_g1_i1::g.147495::m.147495
MAVRTLYVTGFPPDVTERELYLCFRKSEGFERLIIQRPPDGRNPFAFVQFASPESAYKARDEDNNMLFDPDTQIRLRLEMGKKDIPAQFVSGRDRALTQQQVAVMAATQPWAAAGAAALNPFDYSAGPLAKRARYAGQQSVAQQWGALMPGLASAAAPGQSKTLYITNMPSDVTSEVFDQFVQQNFPGEVVGFNLSHTPLGTRAFVGFNDPYAASAAKGRITGLKWKDCAVEVDFARKEFEQGRGSRAGSVVGADETAQQAVPQQQGGMRTVIVLGLPPDCDQETADQWIRMELCVIPSARSFILAKPGLGKPNPILFMQFESHEKAREIVEVFGTGRFLRNSKLTLSLARTELDPSRCTTF